MMKKSKTVGLERPRRLRGLRHQLPVDSSFLLPPRPGSDKTQRTVAAAGTEERVHAKALHGITVAALAKEKALVVEMVGKERVHLWHLPSSGRRLSKQQQPTESKQ
jgi:hypothetical protein